MSSSWFNPWWRARYRTHWSQWSQVAGALAVDSPEPDIASVAIETTTPISPSVAENSAVAQLYQNRDVMDDAPHPTANVIRRIGPIHRLR